MKQNFKLFATLAASAAMMISCQQAEEPTMDKAQEPVVKTRAYGDKTPKVTIYVETNDVNPLNAGDYLSPTVRPMPISWSSSPPISTRRRSTE